MSNTRVITFIIERAFMVIVGRGFCDRLYLREQWRFLGVGGKGARAPAFGN